MLVDIGQAFKLGENGVGISSAPGYQSIGQLVGIVVTNVLLVSNVILFFFILFSGFQMITSAGDAKANEKAKATLTASITGFIIVFAAYWIMQLIEIILGVDILNTTV